MVLSSSWISHSQDDPTRSSAPVSTAPSHREPGLRITDPCPRDVPELPLIANDRRQQQPANMKLMRTLNPRTTHENTLVMRRSLVSDEDLGVEAPTALRGALLKSAEAYH
jgi:hypothetical protein